MTASDTLRMARRPGARTRSVPRRYRRGSIAIAAAITVVVGTVAALGWFVWRPATDVTSALALGQYREAIRWLEPRADSGDPNAQLMLGNLHYLGLGTPADARAAVSLYERAAMQGRAAAQYNVGLMRLSGAGLERDPVEAAAWFLLADGGGEPRAEVQLRQLSGTLNPNAIQLAEQRRRDLEMEMEASPAGDP